jgi:hypothetical protein
MGGGWEVMTGGGTGNGTTAEGETTTADDTTTTLFVTCGSVLGCQLHAGSGTQKKKTL